MLSVDGWVLTRGLLFRWNLASPYFSLSYRESEPQGKPKEVRVGDRGKSERFPITGKTGVGTSSLRENGQTSAW
ncbi:MAG: hypothetical protein VB079_03010 [Petrimonas sp.]|nr:hypothetical protein [Petrimonas sp.]